MFHVDPTTVSFVIFVAGVGLFVSAKIIVGVQNLLGR